MRPSRAVFVSLVAAVATSACVRNGLPSDRSIEATFPTTAGATTLTRQLRVVTFNVHGEPADVVARAIERDPILRRADVIVLQEVHRTAAAEGPCSTACGLGVALGYHAVYAPGHALPGGRTDHGVAIVSRAPITSAQVIELPFFDVHTNSGRRVAIAATLAVDGAPITVYGVHLDNRLNVRDRRAQMMPVLDHARSHTTPTLIAGDFNTSPFTWLGHVVPVLTTTQDNRFEQLMRRNGFATPVRESGATSRFLGMRLDAIYTRGFETLTFATRDAGNISDHLALWADVRPTRARRAERTAQLR